VEAECPVEKADDTSDACKTIIDAKAALVGQYNTKDG